MEAVSYKRPLFCVEKKVKLGYTIYSAVQNRVLVKYQLFILI